MSGSVTRVTHGYVATKKVTAAQPSLFPPPTRPHRRGGTVEKYNPLGFQRGLDRRQARIPARSLYEFDLVDRENADLCHAREIARRPSKQAATASNLRAMAPNATALCVRCRKVQTLDRLRSKPMV